MEMLIDNIEIVPVQPELDIFGNNDSKVKLSNNDKELLSVIDDALFRRDLSKETKRVLLRILNITEQRLYESN